MEKPTFNDGIVSFYQVTNIAVPGNMPKEGLVLKTGPFRYDRRTVGYKRYFTGLQSQVQIDELIRIPYASMISAQDIAVIEDGRQFCIEQIQRPEDVIPNVLDLSLKRLEADYEIA